MTGAAVTWLIIFLANSPDWQKRCREEINAIVLRNRSNQTQSANQILSKLSLQTWETQFPILYQCLQETLRITSTGTFFRKNVSGSDIPIGNSGLVIPHGSYAAYLPDNVHMDPNLYPNPLKFDPGRFNIVSNEENLQEPHTFLGWGSGRHLCGKLWLVTLREIVG